MGRESWYYTPYYNAHGYVQGTAGLGSETDYTYGTQDGFKEFGAGGYYESKHQ